MDRMVLCRVLISLMVILTAMGGGGCSMLESRSPEEIIAERALAQARHLINSDYESALKFVVPSYQGSARAHFYPADFSGSGTWTEAEVDRIRCDEALEPDRCEVRLSVYGGPASVLRSSRGYTAPWTWDTVWIKVNGQWYQFLD